MANTTGLWLYNLVQGNSPYVEAYNNAVFIANASEPSETFSTLKNKGYGGKEYDVYFDSVNDHAFVNNGAIALTGSEYARTKTYSSEYANSGTIDFEIELEVEDSLAYKTILSCFQEGNQSFEIYLENGIPCIEVAPLSRLITASPDNPNAEDFVEEFTDTTQSVTKYKAKYELTKRFLRVRLDYRKDKTKVMFLQGDDNMHYEMLSTEIETSDIGFRIPSGYLNIGASNHGMNAFVGRIYGVRIIEEAGAPPSITIDFADASAEQTWFESNGKIIEFMLKEMDVVDPRYLPSRNDPYLFIPEGVGSAYASMAIPENFYNADTYDIRIAFIIPENSNSWDAELLDLNAFDMSVDGGRLKLSGDIELTASDTYERLGQTKGDVLSARIYYDANTGNVSLFVGKPRTNNEADLANHVWVQVGQTFVDRKRLKHSIDSLSLGSRKHNRKSDVWFLSAYVAGHGELDLNASKIKYPKSGMLPSIIDRDSVFVGHDSHLRVGVADIPFDSSFSVMLHSKDRATPTELPEMNKMKDGVGWSLGYDAMSKPTLILSDGNKMVTIKGHRSNDTEKVIAASIDREGLVAKLYLNGDVVGTGRLEDLGDLTNDKNLIVGDNDFELYDIAMWEYAMTDKEVSNLSVSIKALTGYPNRVEYGLWHVAMAEEGDGFAPTPHEFFYDKSLLDGTEQLETY